MRDLRLCKRYNRYVIQDWSNNRNQVGKKFKSKRQAFKFLNAVLSGRLSEIHFKEYFLNLRYKEILKK